MAHAYTPGLKVTNRMKHSAVRMLPIKGDVMVKVGDSVVADQIVAATYMPGDVYPLNMANILAVPPKDVLSLMICKEGHKVEKANQSLRLQVYSASLRKNIIHLMQEPSKLFQM